MKARYHKRRTRSVRAPGAIVVLLLSYSVFYGMPGADARDGMQMDEVRARTQELTR